MKRIIDRPFWVRGAARVSALRTLAAASLALCLLSGTACVQAPEGVRTLAATEQDDIPAPNNFTFDAEKSYVFDPDTTLPEARFRSWTGYYRGEGSQRLVIPWYVREMPRHGWKLKDIDYDTKKLYFEKGDESAVVSVYREMNMSAGRFLNVVQVRIRPLGPESFSVDQNLKMVRQPGEKAESEPTGASAKPVPATSPPPTEGGARPSSYKEEEVWQEIEDVEEGKSR